MKARVVASARLAPALGSARRDRTDEDREGERHHHDLAEGQGIECRTGVSEKLLIQI
jgi:hypothetical protein